MSRKLSKEAEQFFSGFDKQSLLVTRIEPRYFPGEREAIDHVKKLGAVYGYGNLISHLNEAWSQHLQASGLPKDVADRVGGHVCVWCGVDKRTGKKQKRARRHP